MVEIFCTCKVVKNKFIIQLQKENEMPGTYNRGNKSTRRTFSSVFNTNIDWIAFLNFINQHLPLWVNDIIRSEYKSTLHNRRMLK